MFRAGLVPGFALYCGLTAATSGNKFTCHRLFVRPSARVINGQSGATSLCSAASATAAQNRTQHPAQNLFADFTPDRAGYAARGTLGRGFDDAYALAVTRAGAAAEPFTEAAE